MSLVTSSPIDIEEMNYDKDIMFKEPRYTQWAIDSIVQHFRDILTTIEIIQDINEKHNLNEVYQMKPLKLSENASEHKQLLAKYHNSVVTKFNKKQSVVIKKQFIENYIKHIMQTINNGRGLQANRRQLTKKRGKTKRKGFKY
jgi:hypothetical protein